MDINDLSEKIDSKFDKLHEKLDVYTERVVIVEQKYNSMSGQIKLVFALIGAVVSGIITYIVNKLTN